MPGDIILKHVLYIVHVLHKKVCREIQRCLLNIHQNIHVLYMRILHVPYTLTHSFATTSLHEGILTQKGM